MGARRKREPRSRGFAPPPDYGKLKDQIRSIQDELNYRQGDGESFTHALRSFIESTQDEAARHRQASRDLFKVDDDFANSPAGAVFSTIGGLATLPANISPIGIPVTVAQTYQGGYDDYLHKWRDLMFFSNNSQTRPRFSPYNETNPQRIAHRTKPAISLIPSLCISMLLCVSIVLTLTPTENAISLVLLPSPMS